MPPVRFRKRSDLVPTAGYYTGLATNEANLGASLTDPKESAAKFTDANAACDKAVALDPAAGAVCWKNLGIVLSNKGRMKDAITPLQKATTCRPERRAELVHAGQRDDRHDRAETRRR